VINLDTKFNELTIGAFHTAQVPVDPLPHPCQLSARSPAHETDIDDTRLRRSP
jgi:hypothetical protein